MKRSSFKIWSSESEPSGDILGSVLKIELMLQSNILEILYKKYKHLNEEDIDNIFEIFKRKITESLDEGRKIEIRGFGTISKKINKENMLEIQKLIK